jgi:cation:H+ antiporter
MSDALLIAAGLVLLVLGGELLVRGSVRVAERMGLSPLVIGLTLVGFGTSTPELVTSVQAALIGSPGIAVGNIVGSNIANILLILGIAALLSPIPVPPAALKRDGALVVATALAFLAVAMTTGLDRLVGVVFVAALAAYLVFAYRQEKSAPAAAPAGGHSAAYDKGEAFEELLPHRQTEGAPATAPAGGHSAAYDKGEALEELLPHRETKGAAGGALSGLVVPLLIAVAGLGIVVFGGGLLVDGAVSLARDFGISETVIGLTIVAVGTSMPELVTSIVAAIRRHGDVALGNVLGSNIYNLLGIGGLTALIAPTPVPDTIVSFDAPVMVAVSVVLFVLCWTGRGLSRGEGAALLAGYGAYLWLIWP